MKTIALSAALFAAVYSVPAVADDDNDGAVTGAAGGAVTGAIVGGPAGAAVGGAVGAVAGAVLDPPPPKVVTYVEQQPVPANPVIMPWLTRDGSLSIRRLIRSFRSSIDPRAPAPAGNGAGA